tara:strand:- start:724 stop:981 length:258 start_codon:yes stop_codon:yes gene_type:complete
MKNPCGKIREVDNPYEVWAVGNASNIWEWRVLKKYQAPDKEADNPNARWFCAVKSPFTFGRWEYGDTYINDIKNSGAVKIGGLND